MHRSLVGFGAALLLIVGACRSAPDAPVTGTVYASNGEGTDVVPHAVVQLGEHRTDADAQGRFRIDAAPTGTPLPLEVSGPNGPDAAEAFGRYRRTLTVPREGRAVFVHLLRSCTDVVRGDQGGIVGDDRCAGAGGIEIEVAPGSFVEDGRAYEGPVTLEMTAVAPDSSADRLGLPDDGEGALGPGILGGVQVVLSNGDTGTPVALAPDATARLRMEVALPEGIAESDARLQWWNPDDEVWEDAGPITLIDDGERWFAEAEVTHFSRYRVATGYVEQPTCLSIEPEVCDASGCRRESVSFFIEDQTVGRAFEAQVSYGNGRTCLTLAPERSYQITARYANPLATALFEEPVYESRFPYVSPSSTGDAPTCPDTCTEFPSGGRPLRLTGLQFGCTTATLRSAGGDPLVGPIRILLDGEHVSSAILPGPGVCNPDCGGNVCIQVPVSVAQPDRELVIEGSAGARFRFRPDPNTAGSRCPRTRALPCGYCDGGGACQDLGDIVSDCEDPVLGDCLTAEFTHTTIANGTGCDPATPIELRLDATASLGDIGRYEWFVEHADGTAVSDARRFDPYAVLQRPYCLAAGQYRIELRTQWRTRSWATARADRVISVGTRHPGPCTEQVTTEGSGVAYDCTYSYDGVVPRERSCFSADLDQRLVTTFADVPCGVHCQLPTLYGNQGFPGFSPLGEYVANPAAGAFTNAVDYVYDTGGNVVQTSSSGTAGTSSSQITYDDLVAPTWAESSFKGQASPHTRLDLFSKGGRLVRAHLDSPVDGTADILVDQTFMGDQLDVVTTDWNGQFSNTDTFVYDSAGDLVERVTDTAVGSRVVRTYTYDCW